MTGSAQRHPRRGFALLLVLLVLALAGVALAVAAQQAGQAVLAAGAAQRDLQLKWGRLSALALVMPQAERLLDDQAAGKDEPGASARHKVVLGGTEFDLLLADEQAKANVNLLAAREGEAGAADALASLQRGLRQAPKVELRPGQPPAGVISAVPLRYASLEQVFAFRRPAELLGQTEDEPAPLERITCWGSGRVNVRRAERDVLRATLEGLLTETEIDKLLDWRAEKPDRTVEELLRYLDLPRERAAAARHALADASHCHSLWIAARGLTRSWYTLDVQQQGDAENDAQQWCFAW